MVGTLRRAVVAGLAGSAPMAAIGVTGPRTWSRADWLSDAVPHLVYGIAAAAGLSASW